jgi:tRNA (mo5U34)-methyltransferase
MAAERRDLAIGESVSDGEHRDDRRRRVEELPIWIHTIDLGDGLVTPGVWPPESRAGIAAALEQIDLQGKKVLDIGCLDGFWSFEAERRGAAEVYATDLTSQARPDREPYFRLAKELLGSRVQYFPDLSVFDVARLGVNDFDVVLYLGVYYHLRDPVLSFARLRQVMRDGAVLLVEGQAIDATEAYARFFYREAFQADRSNWWVPTIPCLQEWIESSFFAIEDEQWLPHEDVPTLANTGRHVIRARAERRADPQIACPDPELEAFDLNRYE